MDSAIAGYFGLGLFITQGLHTFHASQTYNQKQVRVLEHLFHWFKREDPATLGRVWLDWLPKLTDDDSRQQRLDTSTSDFSSGARTPWGLDPVQQHPGRLPLLIAFPFRALGLHTTNLYYCFSMSVVYGGIGYVVVRQFPALGPVTLRSIVIVVVGVALLHVFSWYVVGSSIALTIFESNLAFNILVLSALNQGTITMTEAVGLLQLGAALVVGPLVFWLQFQRNQGHIQYGSFLSFYNVIVPVLYAEFVVLVLSLYYN